jgi:HPt (histidine-containing phosphotransfer) domain-containing protein
VAQLEASTGGDPEFTRDIVALFLRQTDAALESSIAAGTAAQVERHAHSLKGSCASLGAKPLAGVLAQMEQLGRQGALDAARDLLAQARTELARVRRALDEHLATSGGPPA